MTTLQVPALVLAAGAGTRLGAVAPKPLAEVAGRTLLGWTLHLLARDDVAPHVVVRGHVDGDAVAAEARRCGAAVVVAEHADRGLAWSLAAGIAAVDTSHGVVVTLADDPLAVIAIDVVLTAARKHDDHVVAVGRRDGAPHPVFLPASIARAFTPPADGAAADQGLRALLHAGERLTLVAAPAGSPTPIDVDTAADLESLAQALHSY